MSDDAFLCLIANFQDLEDQRQVGWGAGQSGEARPLRVGPLGAQVYEAPLAPRVTAGFSLHTRPPCTHPAPESALSD